LKRKHLFFVITFVGNAILFVLISYSGFYIHRLQAPARVGIGTMPVLIMIGLDSSVKAGLPKTGEPTWLTSFLMMCQLYCCAGIMEYGFIWVHMQEETMGDERFDALKEVHARLGKQDVIELNSNGPGVSGADVGRASLQQTDALEIDDYCNKSPLTEGRICNLPSRSVHLSGLTSMQIDTLDMAFCKLDPKDTGAISREDMHRGLRHFNKYYTRRQIDETFEVLLIEPGQSMSPLAFVQWLQKLREPSKDLSKTFFDQPMAMKLDLVMRRVFIRTFGFCVFCWLFAIPFM